MFGMSWKEIGMIVERRRSTWLVVALILVALLGSAQPGGAQTAPAAGRAGTAPAAAPPELARFNDLLAELSERLKPAIVHVRVRRGAPAAKDDAEDAPGERRASGSGFLIDPAGTIVTNAHVIDGAESIQIRLADGRRFSGKALGKDDLTDLALIKIEPTGPLPALVLGNSNRVRVGEFVLALGHPFGLEHSVSFGIVSRKGAPLTVAAPGFDFIQTDAAINPGNSGGPLVNMAGEVIGVNSMAARNGSIGFAIPSNLVAMLVPQLASKGKVEWGWLGVSITEITDEDAVRLKLPEPKGVLIRAVRPGDPADQGGIKADDVITAMDGTRLDGPRDLQRIVASSPVGKRIRVALLRAGQPTEVEVTIGTRKEPDAR
jgi:serine protease Do